jgi:hypothetical protein
LKGYGEFDAANRPSGWNTWLTFSIAQEPPASTVAPTRHGVTKVIAAFDHSRARESVGSVICGKVVSRARVHAADNI